jgi:Family of unknown function (DUF6077)
LSSSDLFDPNDDEQADPLSLGLEAVFAVIAGSLAIFTVATHAALWLSWSFRALIGVALLSLLGAIALAAPRLRAALRSPAVRALDRPSALLLAASVFGAVATALATLRPDSDDAYYLPNAHFYLSQPDVAMSTVMRALADTGVTYHAFVTSISLPVEYFWAALSYATGIEFLWLYYVLVPAAAAALVVGAWFLLLRRFDPTPAAAAFGAGMIALGLLLLGETHHCFGNFSFVRLWQGKTLFLALCLPLFAHYSIGFLKRGDLRSWGPPAALAMASVGLSMSSIFMLPLLAGAIFLGWCAAERSAPRVFLGRGVAFAATLLYPAGVGFAVMRSSLQHLGGGSILNRGFPPDFLGQFELVFGNGASFASGFVLVSLGGAALLVDGSRRRFLLGWLAAATVFFLNPVVAPFYLDNVTSTNTYWRLFYLIPFPLAWGIVATRTFALLPSRRVKAVVCGALATAMAGLAFVPGGPGVLQNVRLEWASPKLDPELRQTATAIMAAAPAGPMLAGEPLSMIFPTLTARFPQVCIRSAVLLAWGERFDDRAMALLRYSAWKFASEDGGSRVAFERLLDTTKIPNIVLMEATYRRPRVAAGLKRRGYENVLRTGGFVLLVREHFARTGP